MEKIDIEWIDSTRSNFDWGEHKPSVIEDLLCNSIGYKIHENDDIIEICQSIADEDKLFVLAIPKCSIIKVTHLTTTTNQ